VEIYNIPNVICSTSNPYSGALVKYIISVLTLPGFLQGFGDNRY